MFYPRVVIENKGNTNAFHKLGSLSSICAVLNQAIIRCNHNTYTFTTTTNDVKEICKNLELSDFTVRKCIKELVSLGILLRVAKGSYKINKEFIELDFKKGTWIK